MLNITDHHRDAKQNLTETALSSCWDGAIAAAAAAAAAAAKSLQLCPTVQPHRQQPTRLPHSWDSPSKNTGIGCHFLLQCMKVKSESEVAQSCPAPSDPMDCSLPGFSIHGIFQARGFMLCPWAMSFFQKLCPAHSAPVSCFFLESGPGPQCCL